jgi:hypothetical protein
MKPTRSRIREQIKEAFEASRESPGSPYEESEIIWHLVSDPKGPAGIHNTFKGKRRLSEFLMAIEAKFAVCFSLKDWESLKSLNQIEDRIAYLLDTPKSSLGSIRNILKARPPDMLVLLVFILSAPLVALAAKVLGVLGLAVLLLPIFLAAKMFQSDRKNKDFYRDLEARIRADGPLDATGGSPTSS